jgi:nucleoside recognition membrane protein YjiH
LATVPAVKTRTRGFIMVGAALIALGANVIDAANDGASVWNVVAIICFAIVLFAGFELVAKNPE